MAEPSRANWDEGQPRTCHACGQTLRITKDELWLDTSRGESWHMRCYLERQQAYVAWRRLMQPRGPVEDDVHEWDRKRELETTLQKTGRDPVTIEWPA